MKIYSEAFEHEHGIPQKHTCEGENTSPPLAWRDLPEGTKSLALIVDDPDAPDPAAPKMTWVHWVLYNLPPESAGLADGVAGANLPAGTLEGQNDWHRTGHGGPCPPIGRHRYFFKLYALDRILPDLHHPTKERIDTAMAGHVLGHGALIGTYQRRAHQG